MDNRYYTRDNIKRFIIKDLLRRKDFLQNVKVGDLNKLSDEIVTKLNNIETHFSKSLILEPINDDFNSERNDKLYYIIKNHITQTNNDTNGN